jgi:hypothetical protein
LRLVKPVSNYAKGKVDQSNRRLSRYGLYGVVVLCISVPAGLLTEFLDAGAGLIAGIMVFSLGLVLVLIGLSSWQECAHTRKGIQGEERVTWELSHLSDEFLLLNDVMLPEGSGNIDHIVIGPTGVFVIETKNYSGKYVCYGDRWFFQGRRQKYDVSSVSVQARNNARVLANLLHSSGFTVDVNPIIVFAHPSIQLWLHSPTVPVLKNGYICNFLLTQKPGFRLTATYSEKLADRILASNRMPTPSFKLVY